MSNASTTAPEAITISITIEEEAKDLKEMAEILERVAARLRMGKEAAFEPAFFIHKNWPKPAQP